MGFSRLKPPLRFIHQSITTAWTDFCLEMGPFWTRRPVLWILPALVLGIFSTRAFWNHPPTGPYALSQFNGTAVQVTGILRDFPDKRAKGTMFIFNAESLRPSGKRQSERAVHGRAWIFAFGADPNLFAPGDRVRIWGRLMQPNKNILPGTFNFQKFLANRRIHSVMFTSSSAIKNLGPSRQLKLRERSWRLHRFFRNAFDTRLRPENSAVLSGLVLGNRPREFPEIKKAFVQTGTMHILVASGSNVAFVMGFWFLAVCLIFRFSKWAALITGLLPVWIYVFVVGADPPILRAGIMGTVAVVAFLLGREDRPIHALFLAGTVMLIIEPRTLFEVGFLMSFASVFGIVYWLPRFEPWVAGRSGTIKWLLRIVLATFTAQVWLFPIMAATFHRTHPIGLFANVIIVPLAAGGFLCGILLAGAELGGRLFPVVSILDPFVNGLSNAYLGLILNAVHFLSDHWGISIWLAAPKPLFTAGFYFFLITVPFGRRSWGKIGIGAAVLILILSFILNRPPKQNTPHFRWIDTGRQTNLIIKTGRGRTILVDPLPHHKSEKINQSIRAFFAETKVPSIDFLILTKPAEKFGNRIAALNESISVKEIWDPEPGSRPRRFDGLLFEPYFASQSFSTRRVFSIKTKDIHILAGYIIPLRIQRQLIKLKKKPFDLIQARFSENVRWDPRFIKKFKPRILIEMGMGTPTRPSRPPWPNIPIVVPQKIHDWTLKGPGQHDSL